jgi:hypothetical protein
MDQKIQVRKTLEILKKIRSPMLRHLPCLRSAAATAELVELVIRFCRCY